MIFFLFQPSTLQVSRVGGVDSSNAPSLVILQKPKVTASTDSSRSLDYLMPKWGSDWSKSYVSGHHLSLVSQLKWFCETSIGQLCLCSEQVVCKVLVVIEIC